AVVVGAVVGVVVVGHAVIVGAVVGVIVVGHAVVVGAVVGVIIVLIVHVHLCDLAGDGIHFILVLHAVHYKLHLILSVAQVVVFLHELDVVPAQLSGEDVLGGSGVDVALI